MFFNDWDGLARVVIVGVLAYVALVALLRVSGKRTLSKMNAFDFVVTVALGSTLATILLSRDVPLVEGLVAFSLLIWGQYAVTWLSVRSSRFQRIIKAQPTLIYFRGRSLAANQTRERVTDAEVDAAIRAQGLSSRRQVEAVVLETDGTFSIVKRSSGDRTDTLELVDGFSRLTAAECQASARGTAR